MARTREQRPTSGALTENPAGASTESVNPGTDTTAEDRLAAYVAGYEQGKAERFEHEVEHYARALLDHDADTMARFARRLAAVKGPAWEAMIVWSGGADD